MTHKIQDNEYFSWIELYPETAEEMAIVLRLTNGSLRETPSITTYFDEKPVCLIQFKKKKSPESYINNKP